MPYLRLRDQGSSLEREFEVDQVRVGRDPVLEYPISDEQAKVVSALHVRIFHRDGAWWIEDPGSRNGTYLDDGRLTPGQSVPLAAGQVIGLGETGPRIKVEAVVKPRVVGTLGESTPPAPPVGPSDPTMPMEGIPEAPARAPVKSAPEAAAAVPEVKKGVPERKEPSFTIVLSEIKTGKRFEYTGGRMRLGRGKECEIQPVGPGDTSVSRVHAEVVLKPDGSVVLRDARSRNGTVVNEKLLTGEHRLRLGDSIRLGDAGPQLMVEELVAPKQVSVVVTADEGSEQEKRKKREKKEKKKTKAPRRSFGGKGKTVFFKELIEETARRGTARVRWLVGIFVVILLAAGGGLYWYLQLRAQETAQALEEQRLALAAQGAAADSSNRAAQADLQRLQGQLDEARESSAPTEVLDSLRQALVAAERRTVALENAMRRAQSEVRQQLAAGDAARRRAEQELGRLQSQLAQAGQTDLSREVIDSLRREIRDQQQRAASIEAQVRAVRGVNLAEVARVNQAAVGLVTAFAPGGVFDGTGFVITASGYFVTNRHVVSPRGGRADSVFITMADQRTPLRADVIKVAPRNAADLAVLRIRNYNGAHMPRVDWRVANVRQGEPAALIGFPAGIALGLDRGTVRTSMSAGIFSKVTADQIQFDGFTVGGSSGSPVFNATGEVVAVHRAGLREAAGLGLAEPISKVVELLPVAARVEAGIR